MNSSAPRRYLIATAVSHYPKAQAFGWDRPRLAEARQRIIDLFTRQLGYQHVSDLGLNPTAAQLTDGLRTFCRASDRRPDDVLAVYVAAHGEVLEDGEHVLLTADTDPEDIDDALPTLTLARKMLRGTRVRRLLLMLDTCFSGQGGNELLAAVAGLKGRWGEETGTGLALLTSAQPNELAETGAFPYLLGEAVASLATAGQGPRELALDALVAEMKAHPKRPGHQTTSAEIIGLTGAMPPFFPNPRHDSRLTHIDLALQQTTAWQAQADRREVEYRTRLLRRAMGHSDPARAGWWFSGRHRALEDITRWLTDLPPDRSALAVTAGPGSGKTAVLGLITTLAHAEYRRTVPLDALGLGNRSLPGVGSLDAAIYAQNLTDQQVLQGIAAAARITATSVADLINGLPDRTRAGRRPLTVLIDALDEAETPGTLCGHVLRPLIDHGSSRIRLLLGTRPHLLSCLGLRREEHIDLDADTYADPEAILVYTVRNLLEAAAESPYLHCPRGQLQAIARQVARAAGRSFLVARIAAGTLAAGPQLPDPADSAWRRSLPRLPSQAIHDDLTQRLRDQAQRATDLLRPLAFAQGQGLPWEDLWAPIATAVSGRPYTNDDLHWLRGAAGAYVVEAIEDGRSVYRLYHEAMAEYLRHDQDLIQVHSAIATVLRGQVPYRVDTTPDWAHAHPYSLRHLATHAALGGRLDENVTDTEYLVHAAPDELARHLHLTSTDDACLHAAVYRASLGRHRPLPPADRRQILAIDATRYNSGTIRRALNAALPPSSWMPFFATGSDVSPALRNTMTGSARTVACAELEGRPIAVTGEKDGTVRIWDLITSRPVGAPLAGHSQLVLTVACTELEGRPLAVTCGGDGDLRVWDLATRLPLGVFHVGLATAAVCTELEGRPIAVTGGFTGTVDMWDLATGRPVGTPVVSREGGVRALACAELGGRLVAVTGGFDGTVRRWDLTAGRPLSAPLQGHEGAVLAVACTELNGRAVAVTGGRDGTARVWDLATGQSIGAPFRGHNGPVCTVDCTWVDGKVVALTGGRDCTARMWDLSTGRSIGAPFSGHGGTVYAVDCARVGDRAIAVTCAADSALRTWDLTAGQPIGAPLSGHDGRVIAVACAELNSRTVAVTGGEDGPVRTWDLTAGRLIDVLAGHEGQVNAAVCAELDGRPVAVTGGDDGTVRMWDLAIGRSIGVPLTGHDGSVQRVGSIEVDGRVVAVTSGNDGTVRMWDLTSRRPVGAPLRGHDGPVQALACIELEGRPIAVTGGNDHTVRVWDLTTRRPVGAPLRGHSGPVYAAACTYLEGRPIAITGGDDGTVGLWDLTARRQLGDVFLEGHDSWVVAVACAELDGRPVAVTGGTDSTICVWDLNRRVPTRLHLPSEVGALDITRTGTLVSAVYRDICALTRKTDVERVPSRSRWSAESKDSDPTGEV
ncbi:caspase family protein [Streptomyces olivaceoviridis]|uniref:caspase family protein n=1 Tax=Streptomyces olivaceoviridis TaxID=1921 RepID=UPI0036A44A1D